MESIQIQTFGIFSLRTETSMISSNENRSRKVWMLLAYLIYNRHRVVPQSELIELLWNEDSQSNNPASALKTTFHRVRTTLDRLWTSAGHDLILRKDDGYAWNAEAPVSLDTDRFDLLCRTSAQTEEEQLAIALEALNLYHGDFMSRLSSEAWVIPISVYYHDLYVQLLLKTLPLLMNRNQQDKVVALCETASTVEPYQETLHYFWIRALLDLHEDDRAATVYNEFSDRLFSNFGIIPSEDLRALYREAIRRSGHQVLTMDMLLEHLQEPTSASGALMCEFDFFVILCRSVSRSMSRTGIATHVALLSVSAEPGKDLPKRSLPHTMDNLGEQIRINLRKGDAASRCSSSQYVVMLPQANYENSCKVCERIVRSFRRTYPHSPANLQYMVYPLKPSL